MNFSGCSRTFRNQAIVVEEHRRKFRIENETGERVKRIRIDGCLIDDHRERCDYLFELGSKCHCAIFVELKGHDVEKAYRQLEATLNHLEARHRRSRRVCHIVASRVPRSGPSVQKLKLQMARKHGVQLFVNTTQVTVDINSGRYSG